MLIVGTFSALSYSSVKLSLFNIPVFDIMDTYFGTYGLSISAVVFILIITWFMDKRKLLEQVNLNSRVKMPPSIITVVKFLFPALVIGSIIFTIMNW